MKIDGQAISAAVQKSGLSRMHVKRVVEAYLEAKGVTIDEEIIGERLRKALEWIGANPSALAHDMVVIAREALKNDQ